MKLTLTVCPVRKKKPASIYLSEVNSAQVISLSKVHLSTLKSVMSVDSKQEKCTLSKYKQKEDREPNLNAVKG